MGQQANKFTSSMAPKRAASPAIRRRTITPSNDAGTAAASEPQASSTIVGATKGLSPEETKVAESKMSKMATRLKYGSLLAILFAGIIWCGHLWACVLVVGLQTRIFYELVKVRYDHRREVDIPWFRTLQWGWFGASLYSSYGGHVHQGITAYAVLDSETNKRAHSFASFSLYITLFVLTVSSFKRGLYKYQFGQLAWTLLSIVLVVGQMRFVLHNIFEGLFWFLFPAALVIWNDSAAYFCGFLWGRKVFGTRSNSKDGKTWEPYPFLPRLSPNKTWEGFLGSLIITTIFAICFSDHLSEHTWMRCGVGPENASFWPSKTLSCRDVPVFTARKYNVQLPYVGHLLAKLPFRPTPEGGAHTNPLLGRSFAWHSLEYINNTNRHPWKGETRCYVAVVSFKPVQLHALWIAWTASSSWQWRPTCTILCLSRHTAAWRPLFGSTRRSLRNNREKFSLRFRNLLLALCELLPQEAVVKFVELNASWRNYSSSLTDSVILLESNWPAH